MLVKLGDIWVDPAQVVFLEPSAGKICVMTTKGSVISEGECNIFAAIVNNAGQSFGGEDETPKKS